MKSPRNGLSGNGEPPRLREALAEGFGIRPQSLQLLRVGQFAQVYAADGLIVKCPIGEPGLVRLRHELAVLERLPADLPVAVPRPLPPAGAPDLIVYERLPGTVHRSAEIDNWPKAKRGRLAEGLGRFMAALHGSGIHLPARPPSPPRKGSSTAAGNRHLEANLPRRDRRDLQRWLSDPHRRNRAGDDAPVPVHGDLNITNLLAGPDGALSGMLDFDAARMAPAVSDFRKLWLVGAQFRDATIAAYVAAGGTPPDPARLNAAEAVMLMKSIRAVRGGDTRATAQLIGRIRQRRAMERRARWRSLLAMARSG